MRLSCPGRLPVQLRRWQGHRHRDGIMARVIPGRGVRRGVFAAAALASAAMALVLLTKPLWQPNQSGADRANVLALPVDVVGVLLTAVSLWFAWKAVRVSFSPSPQEIASRLMKRVLAELQRFIDQALGVHWKSAPADVAFTNLNGGNLPTAMEQLLVNWQDLDGGRAGSIEDVSDFYRRETNGRLVVLGAPGSGKTVLLSHLVRDLIPQMLSTPEKDWPADWRVPIILNLPGCDLTDPAEATRKSQGEQLNAWIVRRLVEDYQLPIRDAAALVRDQHILPILDGLDEMDPTPGDTDADAENQRIDNATTRPHAAAVIQALNADRMPVVLACRDVEYRGVVDAGEAEAASKPRLLTDAQHVVLEPLPAQAIIDYLTDRFSSRTRALPNRWQPVADALNAGEPLLRVLEKPWQLFLAVKAYGQETSDPAELVTMTADQANEQLLAALIPAVTDRDDTAAANGWTAGDVRHWLTSIADSQSRAAIPWQDSSLTDIRLPDLWSVAKRRRRFEFDFRELIAPIIAATPTLLVALAFILVGLRDRGGFLFVGALLAILGLFFGSEEAGGGETTMVRFDLGMLRTSVGRRVYLISVALGALSGAVFGLVLALFFVLGSWLYSVLRPPARLSRLESALSPGLRSWLMNWLESVLLPRLDSVLLPALVFGLAVALVQGLIVSLRGGLEIAPSPSVLAGQCIRYHTACGLASGLAFGVATGLWSGQRLGLAPGLALGLATGLALGLGFGLMDGGSGWLQYAIGARAAVRRNLLPRRPARFLDWCLRVGLMRMAGSSMQFRHRQLQDWLTSPSERAVQAEWQAQWRKSSARH
jgi:hypothetical protein